MTTLFKKTAVEAAVKEGKKFETSGDITAARDRYLRAARYCRELSVEDPQDGSAWLEKAELYESMAGTASSVTAVRRPAPGKPASATPKQPGGLADTSHSDTSSQKPVADSGEREIEGLPKSSFFNFISAEDIKVTFDDIVGLDEAKEVVREFVIYPKMYPEAYNYNFDSSMSMLLEGPPGTGKTTFAKAIAHEINQPFAFMDTSQLVDCYVGETSKHIDEVFAFLRKYSDEHDCGVTIFFDEFDQIGKKRGGDDKSSEAAVPALLRNLDGLGTDGRFLILANTNCAELLDSAILSRFSFKNNVPLPNHEGRVKLYQLKLKEIEEHFMREIDLDRISASSEGLSGRDISMICNRFKYYLASTKAGIAEKEDLNVRLERLVKQKCGADDDTENMTVDLKK